MGLSLPTDFGTYPAFVSTRHVRTAVLPSSERSSILTVDSLAEPLPRIIHPFLVTHSAGAANWQIYQKHLELEHKDKWRVICPLQYKLTAGFPEDAHRLVTYFPLIPMYMVCEWRYSWCIEKEQLYMSPKYKVPGANLIRTFICRVQTSTYHKLQCLHTLPLKLSNKYPLYLITKGDCCNLCTTRERLSDERVTQ